MERLQFAFAHRYVRRAAVDGPRSCSSEGDMDDQQTRDHRSGFPQPVTGVDVLGVDVGDT
jgi:hypothetical protein